MTTSLFLLIVNSIQSHKNNNKSKTTETSKSNGRKKEDTVPDKYRDLVQKLKTAFQSTDSKAKKVIKKTLMN